jgi:hypothetical protein
MEAWREGWTLELVRLFDCGRNASGVCIHERFGRKPSAHPVRLEARGVNA